jgi:hypothetical protein
LTSIFITFFLKPISLWILTFCHWSHRNVCIFERGLLHRTTSIHHPVYQLMRVTPNTFPANSERFNT